ncbi:MAG: hypothetical protein EXS55_00345 [Candidatus Magasanikbacteria bacterium]|nr:hypothetical protein [Candidatus Magasanikbacteria bacterium]
MGREENRENGLASLAEELGSRIDAALKNNRLISELTPDSFKDFDRGLHDAVLEMLPSKLNGKRVEKNWEPFVQTFRETRRDLAALWPTPGERAERDLASVVNELLELLEIEKPAAFSSAWIKEKNKDLFYRVRFQCTDENGQRDWNKVLKHPLFPKYWVDRWRNKRGEKSLHPADVEAAREAVKKAVLGDKISPVFFQKNLDAATFRRINDALPKTEEGRDWEPLFSLIDDCLSREDREERKQAQRKKETKVIASPRIKKDIPAQDSKKSLSLFLEAREEIERKLPEKALLSLVFGAKRGDQAAGRDLEKLLTPLVMEWSSLKIEFKRYRSDNGAAMAVLRWCVERYSEGIPMPFIEYFKLHLQRAARR